MTMSGRQHLYRLPENADMIALFEPRITPATFIVTSFQDAGEGSLCDAIAKANDQEDADVMVLERGLMGAIGSAAGKS
jgi:hypothetical protein